MARGMEHQQLGTNAPGKPLPLQSFHKLPGSGAVGPHKVGTQVFCLYSKIGQRSGPLHQGTTGQCTARAVEGQGQLGSRRLGVQLTGSIHNDASRAALKQVGPGTQAEEHPGILQIDACLSQREYEQEGTALQALQFLRPAERMRLPLLQRISKHAIQAQIRPGGVGRGMYDNKGHEGHLLIK